MKIPLLNQLKLEFMDRIPLSQRGELVKEYKKESGKTLREIADELHIPHTTLHYWIKGRSSPGSLNVSISKLIDHFKIYVPKNYEEVDQIKKLSVVLLDCARRYK